MSVAVTNHAEIQAAYQANYDLIAKAHIAYARAHNGANPFMPADMVETLEAATEALIRRYVTPGARILDAGCGPGTLLMRLEGYWRVGVDMSSHYIDYARSNLGLRDYVFLVVGQLEQLDDTWFKTDFHEAVICTDVLEHVLDEHAVLRELIRVLQPGGHLIIRVPDQEDMGAYWPEPQAYEYVHLRRFDTPTLGLLLEKIHGLQVVEIIPVVYPGWNEVHAVAVKP